MSPRAFNRYMLVIGMGRNRKLVPLTDSEFRAHVAGVLSLAAQAPIRGYFLVGDQEPTPEHVANEAGGKVTARVARSAIAKLKAEGILEYDDDLDAWFVHDWDAVNPSPTKDTTGAERQRRFRERRAAARNGTRNGGSNGPRNGRNGASNGSVTPTEGARTRVPPSTSSSVVPSTTTAEGSSNPARRRGKTLDQTVPPEGLAPHLAAVIPDVLAVVHAAWDERGRVGIEPQPRGIGMGMLRNPAADHLDVAGRMRHWLTAGRGRDKSMADVAKRFGDWCAKATETRGQVASISELDQRRLRSLHSLIGGEAA